LVIIIVIDIFSDFNRFKFSYYYFEYNYYYCYFYYYENICSAVLRNVNRKLISLSLDGRLISLSLDGRLISLSLDGRLISLSLEGRLIAVIGDTRELILLFQRVSIEIQRGNSIYFNNNYYSATSVTPFVPSVLPSWQILNRQTFQALPAYGIIYFNLIGKQDLCRKCINV